MKYKHLTIQDRQMIGRFRNQLRSIRWIARLLGVAPSTISRELKRNNSQFGYCCHLAHRQAHARRHEANQQHRKITKDRVGYIHQLLEKKFSPEQIASTFKSEFTQSISAVSIYRWIYTYFGGGRDNLKLKLRRKGKAYRKYNLASRRIENKPMIADRPDSVNSKIYYGDWEADLMEGPKESTKALLVLVERKTKYSLLRIVENKKSASVSGAILNALKGLKVRTITYDNGSEFADYKTIAKSTESKPFFCNPYHPWEKGLVENTIGLIREYLPKKNRTPLSSHQPKYDMIQNELNLRPRKTLEFRTPQDLINNLTE